MVRFGGGSAGTNAARIKNAAARALAAQKFAGLTPRPAPVVAEWEKKWFFIFDGVARGRAWHRFWCDHVKKVGVVQSARNIKGTIEDMRREDEIKAGRIEVFAEYAWFCLNRNHFPRKQCCLIVLNPWFDRLVLLAIAANCITMTVFMDPVLANIIDGPNGTQGNEWAESRWLLPVLSPTEGCTLESGICSPAQRVDAVFLFAFTIEMFLKMMAMGLVRHPNAYLRSGWNWLDLIVVVAGFLELLSTGRGGITTLRLAKMLRPLRSVQRVRGMRVIVQSILEAWSTLLNVMVFLFFFLVIFGLFGVSFFQGKLRYECHALNPSSGEWEATGARCDADCTWDDKTLQLVGRCGSLGSAAQRDSFEVFTGSDNPYGNGTLDQLNFAWPWRWTYTCRPRELCMCASAAEEHADYEHSAACGWNDNPNYGINSFDSLPWAMVTLFQAITLEGWIDVTYQLMDACSVFVVFYFVPIVFFGGLVLINLFLAVLVTKYSESETGMYDEPGVGLDDFDVLDPDAPDEEEELAKDAQKLTHKGNCFRQRCLDVVNAPAFTTTVNSLILINTLIMMLKWVPGPTNVLMPSIPGEMRWEYLPMNYFLFLSICNVTLTFLFLCESCIKIIGLGPTLFKKDRMNVFDLVVVLFSVLEITLDYLRRFSSSEITFPLPLSVLRTFRIFRLFKLAKSVPSLRKVFSTLSQSLGQVVYLALLLCLVVLIFILLGMELFGGWYPRPELGYSSYNNPAIVVDEASRYHFDDFGSALLSVFVVLSGENWNEIMFDSHTATWDGDTSGPPYFPFAIGYFILLFFVGNLILFNLFVAILLINFGNEPDEVEEEEEDEDYAEYSKADAQVETASAVTAEPPPSPPSAADPVPPPATRSPSLSFAEVLEKRRERREANSAVKDQVAAELATLQTTAARSPAEVEAVGFDLAMYGQSTASAWDAPPSPPPTPPEQPAQDARPTGAAPSRPVPPPVQTQPTSTTRDGAVVEKSSAEKKKKPKPAEPNYYTYQFGSYRCSYTPGASNEAAATLGPEPDASLSPGGSHANESKGASQDAEKRLVQEPSIVAELGVTFMAGVNVSFSELWKLATELLEPEEGHSLGLFSGRSRIRRGCCVVLSHPWFEPAVIILIILSTITLVIDLPHLQESHPLRTFNVYCNYVFTALFIMEALLKIITSSFLFPIKARRGRFWDFSLRRCLHRTEAKPRAAKEALKKRLAEVPAGMHVLLTPYLHDPWNALDFAIVIVSIMSLFNIPAIESLRALRALRPLRLVSRYQDLKITVDTLVLSIPAMVSLMAVSALFFIIFAILGLELFGGRFGWCQDPLYADLPFGGRVIPGMNGEQTDYEECMALPRYNLTRRTTDGILLSDMADAYPDANPDWLEFTEFPQWMYPQFGSFDNIGMSLILLFELSALEGWPDVMHYAMDSDREYMFVENWKVPSWLDGGNGGVGEQMQQHDPMNAEAAAFMILWIIVGCFVIVNLTVGVVVDQFADKKKEAEGALLMTPEAASWVRTQKDVIAKRPLVTVPEPSAEWRRRCYHIATSAKFEVVMMAVISLNMLQMACDYWEPAVNHPNMYNQKLWLKYVDYFFVVAYTTEIVIKCVGLTVFGFFADTWNIFDFGIVTVAYMEIILVDFELPFPPALLRLLRLFRVIRLLRVMRISRGIRAIMLTVWISVPQLKNIMVLILLLILIFDMLCVNLFFGVNYTPGNFDLSDNWSPSFDRGEVYFPTDYHFSEPPSGWGGTNWGDSINRHANFGFFWSGFLTLVRCATGESFNGVMHDLYGYEWGHNRLSCCFECGPILNGHSTTLELTIPSTNVTVLNREVPNTSCGNSEVGFVIYLTFQVVMAYIVLSIMIGVILDNFANMDDTRKITFEDIEEFRRAWLLFDPRGTFTIPSHQLLPLLQSMSPPLGFKEGSRTIKRMEILEHIGELNIPDHGGVIHFTEVLTACTYRVAGQAVPECDATKRIQKALPHIPHLKELEPPCHNSHTNYLVSVLSTRFRAHIEKEDGPPDGSAGQQIGSTASRGCGLSGSASGSAAYAPSAAAGATNGGSAGGSSGFLGGAMASMSEMSSRAAKGMRRATQATASVSSAVSGAVSGVVDPDNVQKAALADDSRPPKIKVKAFTSLDAAREESIKMKPKK